MSTSKPERVKENIDSINKAIPDEFWQVLKDEGLVRS
jgi:hypothetical protein